MRRASLYLACLLLWGGGRSVRGAEPPLQWQPWSPQVFEQAKQQHRFVLLNLHAVWCHWCHVMEEETYRDPKVLALLRAKYITVQVDADSRPDLANRYEDYGWPATIVFDEKGGEIVKRRGFMPPDEMASLLQAIIDDPSPGPSVEPPRQIKYAEKAAIPPDLRATLQENLGLGYDSVNGSWGFDQKYLDWDNVEYCLNAELEGDKNAGQMARQTLSAQLKLVDQVWGGVSQYSTDGDWEHPHFEKLIQFQAGNLQVFALAYALWGDSRDLETAQRIRGYVRNFLTSPDGAFYVSQDADLVAGEHSGEYYAKDDAGRRRLGIPRVDRHIYPRENGWMIHALAELYRATGDSAVVAEAQRAADWIVQKRSLPEGGFHHDETDPSGPFLGDTLWMGQAFLDLYSITADRKMLAKAQAAGDFIIRHFIGNLEHDAGLSTARPEPGALSSSPQFDENVAAARFGNLLFCYTGESRWRQMSECAMRYLATPDIALRRHPFIGGVLSADRELSHPPLHVTVSGSKSDSVAKDLFLAALKCPAVYKQTEWYDPAEGRFPGSDIEIPVLAEAAAFVCANGACSAPLRTAAALTQKLPHATAKP